MNKKNKTKILNQSYNKQLSEIFMKIHSQKLFDKIEFI